MTGGKNVFAVPKPGLTVTSEKFKGCWICGIK